MSDLFTTTRNWVLEVFGEEKMPHFDRTVYWVEQLKPDADDALRIAAIAHDIERGLRNKNQPSGKVGFLDEETLTRHQEVGAEKVGNFLVEHRAPSGLVERVRHLVAKHEVGGDDDQNLLKDADSVSFLETQIEGFLKNKVPLQGKEEVRKKFQWMFDRITSDKAKEFARPNLETALNELDNA